MADPVSAVVASNVVFLRQEETVGMAVQLMKESSTSHVLITDRNDRVVGIVTERDIVRRFTLAKVADKLSRTVATVMGRPVRVARLDHLMEDVVRLHLNENIRHFPISKRAEDPKKGDIVGIVTITDLARAYIVSLQNGGAVAQGAPVEMGARLVLASHHPKKDPLYEIVFKGLGYETVGVETLEELQKAVDGHRAGVVIDVDSYSHEALEPFLQAAGDLPCPGILATEDRARAEGIELRVPRDRWQVAMKPLNLSLCHRLLSKRLPPALAER